MFGQGMSGKFDQSLQNARRRCSSHPLSQCRYAKVTEKAPNATILVIGPAWTAWADDDPSPAMLVVRDTLKAQAEAAEKAHRLTEAKRPDRGDKSNFLHFQPFRRKPCYRNPETFCYGAPR